jgi:hypothetical protein
MKVDHAAQCRFFTAEDACRIALQAYYAAGRSIQPPPGEPWIVDGDPYAGPADFADAFSGELQARLSLLALDRLGTFDALTMSWNLHKLAADIEPEKMAPIIAAREAELAQAYVDIFGDEMNRLHPGDNAAHNHQSEGVGNAG